MRKEQETRGQQVHLGTISTVGSRPLRRLKTAGNAEATYAALLTCLELQRAPEISGN
jgi:hypothetical protein